MDTTSFDRPAQSTTEASAETRSETATVPTPAGPSLASRVKDFVLGYPDRPLGPGTATIPEPAPTPEPSPEPGPTPMPSPGPSPQPSPVPDTPPVPSPDPVPTAPPPGTVPETVPDPLPEPR